MNHQNSEFGLPQLRLIWRGLALLNGLLLVGLGYFDDRQRGWLDALRASWPGPEFWERYGWFMERSVFDDGVLGGSDIGVLYVLAMLVVLLGLAISPRLRRGPDTPMIARLRALRTHAAFTVTVGLVCGLGVVHGLKTITGRVRPGAVYQQADLFTAWYQPGANFLDGMSSSFPSGHTGAVMLLFTLPVGLAGRHPRAALWGTFIVLAFAWAMALGRCVSAHHWFSDTLASIVLYLVLVPLIARLFGQRTGGSAVSGRLV